MTHEGARPNPALGQAVGLSGGEYLHPTLFGERGAAFRVGVRDSHRARQSESKASKLAYALRAYT